MKTNQYFKSSLAVAASGLSVGVSYAGVTTISHNVSLDYDSAGSPTIAFDITGDATDDYQFLFANNNAQKPQLTTSNFGAGGINQVFLNSPSGDDYNTLPVLSAGTEVGPDLAGSLGGVTFEQGFFYQNWNANSYGDWGGTPAGASAPDPVQGPISGYVGLAIPTDDTLSDFNYGYAHFMVDVREAANDPAVASVTLLETAFEMDVNKLITIVPEPTVAALVTGALGVLGLRLRRARR